MLMLVDLLKQCKRCYEDMENRRWLAGFRPSKPEAEILTLLIRQLESNINKPDNEALNLLEININSAQFINQYSQWQTIVKDLRQKEIRKFTAIVLLIDAYVTFFLEKNIDPFKIYKTVTDVEQQLNINSQPNPFVTKLVTTIPFVSESIKPVDILTDGIFIKKFNELCKKVFASAEEVYLQQKIANSTAKITELTQAYRNTCDKLEQLPQSKNAANSLAHQAQSLEHESQALESELQQCKSKIMELNLERTTLVETANSLQSAKEEAEFQTVVLHENIQDQNKLLTEQQQKEIKLMTEIHNIAKNNDILLGKLAELESALHEKNNIIGDLQTSLAEKTELNKKLIEEKASYFSLNKEEAFAGDDEPGFAQVISKNLKRFLSLAEEDDLFDKYYFEARRVYEELQQSNQIKKKPVKCSIKTKAAVDLNLTVQKNLQ